MTTEINVVPTTSVDPPPLALMATPKTILNNQGNPGGTQAQEHRKRLRFNLRYIGSTMLHKNFTLPMLEWIAKDVKRQTVRGAQNVSQRQFTIPARDIVLEIQSYKLTAVSSKDGHCIFVHPMHCVTKYAQLQYDQTSFSYLFRDSKESPLFCHVFQARSIAKVHDIFKAIREATTRVQIPLAPIAASPDSSPDIMSKRPDLKINNSLQKSASSELKNLFGALALKQHDIRPLTNPTSEANQTLESSAQANFAKPNDVVPSFNNQFESSYQFEVMFVRKVKVQSRRVPASFVDDALETLKSFEVMKSSGETKSQIRSLGNRIINVSVDERQEYDEVCPPPAPVSAQTTKINSQSRDTQSLVESSQEPESIRRGSSISLHKTSELMIREERESRSCQQSPTKVTGDNCTGQDDETNSEFKSLGESRDSMKKHQSIDCLKSLDSTIRSAKNGKAPSYANDFSPYNKITNADLNKRIAAIPMVSSSVSLDHETRQKLARQVRETIMATAANIKKDVYASGDKLDSSASSKALDALSCTTATCLLMMDENDKTNDQTDADQQLANELSSSSNAKTWSSTDTRRQSIGPLTGNSSGQQVANNYDLFRRASARQVIKNRTMLLLIGKEDLCTISTDKHQVLFSKPFNSIVHCLQGSNNKDHFGFICRDSSKINPNAESYAGFIFKCQSEKVVREIMGALKQVIYNSQHNYHGMNSLYNPLNAMASTKYHPINQSPKLERLQLIPNCSMGNPESLALNSAQQPSLATKRGFANLCDVNKASSRTLANITQHQSMDSCSGATGFVGGQALARSGSSSANILAHSNPGPSTLTANQTPTGQPKNLIKSMFCDNCPLYWYHRLCCDLESLPAEASKTIILRRIDSSLTDKDQDELYSKFSEFSIDSVDEHNEIFMSLLRQQCERKQSKHGQSSIHIAAMNKNSNSKSLLASKQSSFSKESLGPLSCTTPNVTSELVVDGSQTQHKRSGSSSGSLASIVGPPSNQSIVDASSIAIDNLMRAKNSISSSIENMLKRRSSIKDKSEEPLEIISLPPTRSGSFKDKSKDFKLDTSHPFEDCNSNSEMVGGLLKRSQSTSDHSDNNMFRSSSAVSALQTSAASLRDSLTRTLNDDLSRNPLVGLFRRRNSLVDPKTEISHSSHEGGLDSRASSESLAVDTRDSSSLQHSPASNESRFMFPLRGKNQSSSAQTSGGVSPSGVLSGAFWKKSIFDKIRQPSRDQPDRIPVMRAEITAAAPMSPSNSQDSVALGGTRKRTRDELRALWRRALIEQVTLLKMEKQNQNLATGNDQEEDDAQQMKLNYRDLAYSPDAPKLWNRLLKQDPTKKVEFTEVAKLVRRGVTKKRRGEIWMFLMNQYQLRHGTSFQCADSEYHGDANQSYRSLLSKLSTQQHEIFVDIGRTFPSHPYYSQCLGIGQLSLFNVLKAYSLLDPEVGYCQGLSFVAGVLLLHVDTEDEAFEFMRHLLFNFGLRRQYLPSMDALHLQLYQMTRLLRDYEYELFDHFDRYDISPSLYAAPWFLTLFASQFPLGFVARLIDMISLIGIEAIFRVSLNLLAHHKPLLLACTSLESSMEYVKRNLIKVNDTQLAQLIDKSMTMDLRNKLIEYEIEYTFYCAEDKAKPRKFGDHVIASRSSGNPSCEEVNRTEEGIGRVGGIRGGNQETLSADPVDSSQVADATATIIMQHLLANFKGEVPLTNINPIER